jgi:hypothetical protein
MSWFDQAFRKVHILYVSPEWARGRGSAFDAGRYAESLAEARVECVELYTKDRATFPARSGDLIHAMCSASCCLSCASAAYE